MKNYSDDEIKKLNEEYNKLINKYQNLSWIDFAEKINSMNHPDKIEFQSMMITEIIGRFYSGYWFYNEKLSASDKELRQIIFDTVKTFPKDRYYYWSVYYFFEDDRKNLEKTLDKFFSENNTSFEENPSNEIDFANLLDIFKNAYSKFWEKMSARFKKVKNTQAENLCILFEKFYYDFTTDDERENLLVNYIQENPETILAKEFLGFTYENMKRWYNAISIFEQVAGKSVFHYYKEIYFHLAWCYGKVKEYADEEENYRKCLEIAPNYEWALNNLGWSLYRQKKYDEAEKIFLQCLKENRIEEEQKFSANNLVRTYLITGQIEAAKKFIDSKKFKISKYFIDKVKKHSKQKNVAYYIEFDSDDENIAENKKFSYNEIKSEQFTSEKILEDEIVSRIESGKEIFGLNLKIYRRKGDNYGRQYSFNDGKNIYRIDILCEDERGNFYIIELKKDSGYADAYQQIKNYVDYFEKNRANGKKVFGILCLNSPTEKLLEDVRRDSRIRLFEYKISYNELF